MSKENPANSRFAALPDWQKAVFAFVLYTAGAWLGELLTVHTASGGTFSTFWPPSGIALALLLLSGTRSWPLVITSCVAANLCFDLSLHHPFRTSLLFSIGNVAEFLTGALILNKSAGSGFTLHSIRRLVLLTLSAAIAAAVSATSGASVVTFVLHAGTLFGNWPLWWSAKIIGIIVFTPLLLFTFGPPLHQIEARRMPMLEFVAIILVSMVFVWFSFATAGILNDEGYMLIPLLLWAALRLGPSGAVTINFVVALCSVWIMATGKSNFHHVNEPPGSYLPSLQLFLGAMSFTSVAISLALYERSLYEHTLVESESKFRLITEGARDLIYKYRLLPTPGFEYVSPSATEITGYTPEEHYSDPELGFKLVHPADRNILENVKSDPAAFDKPIVLRWIRKDGTIIWTEQRNHPVVNKGRIVAIEGIARDITERMQLELKLAESLSYNQAVFDASPVGILTYKATGQCTSANNAASTLVGGTHEQLLAQNFRNIDSWKQSGLLDAAEKALSTNEAFREEFHVSTTFGKEVMYEALFAPFAVSGEKHLMLILHDITDSISAREELDRTLSLFKQVLSSLDTTVLLVDMNTREIYECNHTAETMFGYARSEMIGKTTEFLHVSSETFAEFGRKLYAGLEASDHFQCEYRMKRRNGEIFPTEHYFRPITGKGGVHSVVGVIRDITERKHEEEEKGHLVLQLHQSQKMEAIGHLAGGIAHDFNNMLGIILGAAQLTSMSLPQDSEGREEQDMIIETSLRAKELTMKLLSFARMEKPDAKPVPVSKVAGDIVQMLRRTISKHITIVLDAPPDLPNCLIDETQIKQALLNLCNNAADAMPNGGTLTVAASEAILDEKYCARHDWMKPGHFCSISVSDTGIGIPESIIGNIFDPFFTTKGIGKGTGLGLSVSHGLVRNHGGHIEVKSTPGEGTTMTIYMPAATASELSGAQAAGAIGGVQQNAFTIMLVDDETHLLNMITKLLSLRGFNVIACASPAEALDTFSRRHKEIDLAILDFMMPGMDARELFFRMKDIDPSINVLIASGYSEHGGAGELLAAGAKGFVQKPFDIETLCALINKALS